MHVCAGACAPALTRAQPQREECCDCRISESVWVRMHRHPRRFAHSRQSVTLIRRTILATAKRALACLVPAVFGVFDIIVSVYAMRDSQHARRHGQFVLHSTGITASRWPAPTMEFVQGETLAKCIQFGLIGILEVLRCDRPHTCARAQSEVTFLLCGGNLSASN